MKTRHKVMFSTEIRNKTQETMEKLRISKLSLEHSKEYEILQNFIAAKKQRRSVYKLSTFSYIKRLCCGKFKTTGPASIEDIYEDGMNIIENKISFINFLNVCTDIENMKKILFSKEQLCLLEMVSKNKLSSKDNNSQDKDDFIFNTFDCLKNAMTYLKALQNSPENISEFDKKLISLLDSDVSTALLEALQSEV